MKHPILALLAIATGVAGIVLFSNTIKFSGEKHDAGGPPPASNGDTDEIFEAGQGANQGANQGARIASHGQAITKEAAKFPTATVPARNYPPPFALSRAGAVQVDPGQHTKPISPVVASKASRRGQASGQDQNPASVGSNAAVEVEIEIPANIDGLPPASIPASLSPADSTAPVLDSAFANEIDQLGEEFISRLEAVPPEANEMQYRQAWDQAKFDNDTVFKAKYGIHAWLDRHIRAYHEANPPQ